MQFFTYAWRYGLGTVSSAHDPGPCPVDDAPHTTCTSADYQPRTIIPQLPARDALVGGDVPPPPSDQSIVVAPTVPPPSSARRSRRAK